MKKMYLFVWMRKCLKIGLVNQLMKLSAYLEDIDLKTGFLGTQIYSDSRR
jgi:hypothetical protein